MKVLGNGIDIVSNLRIKKSIKNKIFLQRIYTYKEIKSSHNKKKNIVGYFAKRFAAKEAFVKALGEGFRNNVNFNDIEILNDKKGRPLINISKNIKKLLKKKFKLNKYKIFLSLSDERKYSIAYVIINKQK